MQNKTTEKQAWDSTDAIDNILEMLPEAEHVTPTLDIFILRKIEEIHSGNPNAKVTADVLSRSVHIDAAKMLSVIYESYVLNVIDERCETLVKEGKLRRTGGWTYHQYRLTDSYKNERKKETQK